MDDGHDEDDRPPVLHRGLPQVVNVAGGLPEPFASAVAGEHRWQQLPDESPEQFHDRVIIAATASREPLLVFNGLPQ